MYQLPILTYHRVVDPSCQTGKHNIFISKKRFVEQLDYLKNNNYQTITFRDLEKIPAGASLEKKVILTFDDGYVDNYTILFPLLKQYGFTAVVFLVTQQTRNEWGVAEGEPAVNLMSKEMMLELDAYGIEFGGHTQKHIDLSKAYEALVKKEIEGCKADLEALFNKPAISFAYPFGGLNEQVKRIVKESGFKYGIATKSGPFELHDDLFQIRRQEISTSTRLFSFKHKVSGVANYTSPFSFLFK